MRFLFKLFMGLQVFIYRLTGGKLGGSMGKFKDSSSPPKDAGLEKSFPTRLDILSGMENTSS